MKSIHISIRDLRAQKLRFHDQTLSSRDLRRHGLSLKEIGNITSVTKFGEIRFEKIRVWDYLTHKK